MDKLIIQVDKTIKDALKQLDLSGEKVLFIVDNEKRLIGIITDGDIRRHLLKKGDLHGTVEDCYNKNPTYFEEGYSLATAKKIMLTTKKSVIPIIDGDNKVVDFITWDQVFGEAMLRKEKIDIPVVIMAGGKGTRLDPFTKILPKPLIPIGEKPIIEIIMDKFSEQGVNDFYLTVNYKGEMIKSYFDNTKTTYNIHYIWEKEYTGTAGSLKLLTENFNETFIVSNCDIIVEANYVDLLNFHKKNHYCLTVVGSIQHFRIPYGIIEFQKGGSLRAITEKPEYDLVANTGLYVLEKNVLQYLPKSQTFHMTDLINRLLSEGQSVGVYPVSEKSYVDIGHWEEYKKNFEKFMAD